MLTADFIAFAAFNAVVFIIQIIELQLYEFHLRMIRQNLIQKRRLVMERQPHMSELPLRLQIQRCLICIALLVMLVVVSVLRMHQIEIEIIHTTDFQLVIQDHANVFLRSEIAFR